MRLLSRFLVFLACVVFSSALTAKKFEEVTYEQIQEIKKGKTDTYITSRGEKFSVGQTITFGTPNRKDHREYDYIFVTVLNSPTARIQSTWDGYETTIKNIRWAKGTVVLKTKTDKWKLMIANFEAALESGEIVSSVPSTNSAVNKRSAINKLKEAKELLDLEVITQDEYDAMKKSLAPIIKSN